MGVKELGTALFIFIWGKSEIAPNPVIQIEKNVKINSFKASQLLF
jgi:hypothetical protein